eukprot:scaffold977_cov253-Pinguiococcus_pyrenoidosus.AAC.8
MGAPGREAEEGTRVSAALLTALGTGALTILCCRELDAPVPTLPCGGFPAIFTGIPRGKPGSPMGMCPGMGCIEPGTFGTFRTVLGRPCKFFCAAFCIPPW